MRVELRDEWWAPRVAQLRERSLPVMLDNLERQGSIDALRRLVPGSGVSPEEPRRSLHFSDSDVYKWLEAAVLAGEDDLAEPVIALVEQVQSPDGYLHSYYGTPGAPGRYVDLDFGHEHYCFGHLFEAAVSQHETSGSDRLLRVATHLADHLLAIFGPRGDQDPRTDAHPEVELALCRLARATGEERYVAQARWIIEARLAATGSSLEEVGLNGHAVRALYLASGIAEVALATGDARWREAATRLFDAMLTQHAYPTGAVGGRWLGEMVGKPFEQPDAMAYAESCAAVAAAQLCQRIWALDGDVRAIDQLELLLYNAVPAGVGAAGDRWFYAQPHAVAAVAPDPNPWVYDFEYGQLMLRSWFPARRHRWFDVPCCPPNLGRLFAGVDRSVARVDASGDLFVDVPLAMAIRGDGWEVDVTGTYPDDGEVTVTVRQAPAGRSVWLRRPGWAGGAGHERVPADGRVSLPVAWTWWRTDRRVEGGGDQLHLRRGPVVHCLEGVDHPGVDLADVVVDPTRAPEGAFRQRIAEVGPRPLHAPVGATAGTDAGAEPLAARPVPYATWANRGATTMRLRFPQAQPATGSPGTSASTST